MSPLKKWTENRRQILHSIIDAVHVGGIVWYVPARAPNAVLQIRKMAHFSWERIIIFAETLSVENLML